MPIIQVGAIPMEFACRIPPVHWYPILPPQSLAAGDDIIADQNNEPARLLNGDAVDTRG